ncbi:hypothetical protein [Streptomyces sp. NPDC048155]|uniref:MmyB family transcriptional regulator n=1 Tax=Streptomyces sp. NPDC048155 TaxID=3154818 RepID=UPI0033EC992A
MAHLPRLGWSRSPHTAVPVREGDRGGRRPARDRPRYPDGRQLRRPVEELRTNSDRFAELRDVGAAGRHDAARKTIDHPQVGSLTLDCDVLSTAGSDLRIVIYTAEPGTQDAERLPLRCLHLIPAELQATGAHPRCPARALQRAMRLHGVLRRRPPARRSTPRCS